MGSVQYLIPKAIAMAITANGFTSNFPRMSYLLCVILERSSFSPPSTKTTPPKKDRESSEGLSLPTVESKYTHY